VSANTASHMLAENTISRLPAKRKPWVTDRHRRARLQWAKDHADFTLADWYKV